MPIKPRSTVALNLNSARSRGPGRTTARTCRTSQPRTPPRPVASNFRSSGRLSTTRIIALFCQITSPSRPNASSARRRLTTDPTRGCFFGLLMRNGCSLERLSVIGSESRVAQSVPLVEGTPVHRGSISSASRRARAHALKTASLMWCVLRPWCRITCKFIRPCVPTACQKSATSSLSNSPILGRRHGHLPDPEGPPAQVDRGGHEGLVHRQERHGHTA